VRGVREGAGLNGTPGLEEGADEEGVDEEGALRLLAILGYCLWKGLLSIVCTAVALR
jgi:hypothetical protein